MAPVCVSLRKGCSAQGPYQKNAKPSLGKCTLSSVWVIFVLCDKSSNPSMLVEVEVEVVVAVVVVIDVIIVLGTIRLIAVIIRSMRSGSAVMKLRQR